MRILCGLLALVFCTIVRGESTGQGSLVKGPSSQDVIFSPAMMKGAINWGKDVKVTYWTPSRALIAKAEKALPAYLDQIRTANPPEGFHVKEYYTPKYYSRDRVTHIPVSAYNWDFDFLSRYTDIDSWQSSPRQYAGMTVDGKKVLTLNVVGDPASMAWKKHWLGNNWVLDYVVATGQFELELRTIYDE